MPLIPIYFSTDHIINIHNYLIEVYREEKPPVKMEPGINYAGTIEHVCYSVSSNNYRDKKWSHFLEKAAYMFYYLNRGHPFIDGNKRTALLITYYFCLWNGYFLRIPEDADKILVAIADTNRKDITYEDAYNWILENIICSPITCCAHLLMVGLFSLAGLLTKLPLHDLLNSLLYGYPHAETLENLLRRAHIDYAGHNSN